MNGKEMQEPDGLPDSNEQGLACLKNGVMGNVAAFLDIQDLGRADSAMANQVTRRVWLESLQGLGGSA